MEKTLNSNTGSIVGEKLGNATKALASGTGIVLKEGVEIAGDVAKSGAELLSTAKSVVRTLTAGLEKGTQTAAIYANKMEKSVVAYDPTAERQADAKPGFFSSLADSFKKGYNS